MSNITFIKTAVPRKDTGAWIMQTWLAFLTAVSISCFGIAATPGDVWVKGFLFIGLAFVLSATFTLSKTLRDNQAKRVDTSQWIMQVWIAFMLAGGLSLFGVMNVPGEAIHKGFGLMSLAFSVTASFTLAKTLRDNHEAANFAAADANRDGVVSREEAFNTPLAEKFDALDRSGDGTLTRTEATAR